MPSFPKVFLFSPFWEEYLSRRPYAPLKQSVLPSGSHSDDLSFQVTIGPLHSNSCYFVRGFESLQGCQVFSTHDFPLSDCPVSGLLRADSALVWSGVIGLLREPDYLIIWGILRPTHMR